ncbi:hypothetical protein BDW62DRAFT_9601 [Aspergillus aurantiobrunneus]
MTNPAAQERQVFVETATGDWQQQGDVIENHSDSNVIIFHSEAFKKQHPEYKRNFQEEFWPVLDADINGSFHCQYSCEETRVWPAVSWSCFKVKEVKSAADYNWKQPTIHVQWNALSGRHLVHVFELSASQQYNFLHKLPTVAERESNPFSLHAAFARIILEQYDGAFWMLRDLVRHQEKARSKSGHKTKNFPLLHDIARHLFHYQETIEVAEHTLQMLVSELVRWRREDLDNVRTHIGTWMKSRQLILFEEKRAHSLKTRSKSLNDRHQNEINLAFNLVSQSFGRDARSDSNMMKTVAVVSMVYLPGTFVSGLFGTNFFSFQADPGNTWLTADEFWIYWAVTVPLTLATVAVWAVWHWRETYGLWWHKVTGRRSGRDDSDATTVSPVSDASDEKSSAFFAVRRIATALRLNEVQRQETV